MSEKKARIVSEELQCGRHAGIEIRRNGSLERSVISYPDEDSLGELIAVPGIVGIAFSSPQAAVAVVQNSFSRNADSKSVREKPVFRCEDDHRRPPLPRQHLRHPVRFTETGRIAFATLQNAVLAGVLMFHSRSVLGAVIRAFVCT
jgi:hypothetical protein